MSKKKSTHKKDQGRKPDTGAVLAAKSSSVSFPPVMIEEPKASKQQVL